MKNVRNTVAMTLIAAMVLTATAAVAAGEAASPQVVNINTASPAQLETLPGIGPSKAQAIVDHRTRHPFGKPEDIMKVKGIGKKSFLKLKPYVAVSEDTKGAKKTPPAQQ